MSRELAYANEKWLDFDCSLKELYKYYSDTPDSCSELFDIPTYVTKIHMIHAFEKCANGDISEEDLAEWVDGTWHNPSIKPEASYRKLINGIFQEFDSFQVNPDEDLPDQNYVLDTLNKLRNAKPEI